MRTTTSREEYLIKGHNGLETCVILSEDYASLLAKRKFMERDTVKEVLRRFNQSGVRYCLVGGLALAHHAIPRLTQEIDERPVKVASLRDLILLKVWAAPDRPERARRMQDETDVIGLIELNPENVSADDIAYICRTLLTMAYTPEAVKKYRAQVEWLNDELDKLGLSDRRYRLE